MANEEIFRSKVLAMLKAEGKACPGPRSGINDHLIEKLMAWHHSGSHLYIPCNRHKFVLDRINHSCYPKS
jgi:hypothetical protein